MGEVMQKQPVVEIHLVLVGPLAKAIRDAATKDSRPIGYEIKRALRHFYDVQEVPINGG